MNALRATGSYGEHACASIVEQLSAVERMEVHDISQEAFEDLSKSSLLYQGASFDQLEAELDNSSIKKVLLKESADRKSPTLGYLGIHTTTETLTWLDSNKMDVIFGDALKLGTFAYCSTVEITKHARSLRNIISLLTEGLSLVHHRAQTIGAYAVMGFDCCGANDPAIPMLMQKTANKSGFGYKVHTIGRHDWVRLSLIDVSDCGGETYSVGVEKGIDLSNPQDTFKVQVIKQDNLHGFSQLTPVRFGAFAHVIGYASGNNEQQPVSETRISQIASYLLDLGSVIIDVDATCSPKIIELQAALKHELRRPIKLEIADYQLYSGITKG